MGAHISTTTAAVLRGCDCPDAPPHIPRCPAWDRDERGRVAATPDQPRGVDREVPDDIVSLDAASDGPTRLLIHGITPPPPPRDSAPGDERPSTLDYIAVEPDGCIWVVSAILTADGPLPILQHAVDGLIERVPTSDTIDCYANEEGLMRGLPRNPIGGVVHQQLASIAWPLDLVGTVVLAGTDGVETVSLTADQRRHIVEAWLLAHRDHFLD